MIQRDPLEAGKSERAIDRVLSGLKKEYVLVGKTRVKAWHAWLALGLAAGIAAGIILVANRSGELEPGKAASAKRPNIVVILMDDMRLDDLWVMKNVNALIANDGGISFSNFFVSNSICCPSRATFMTGKYSHNHGVMTNVPGYAGLDDHRNTLGVWLQNAGYYTGYIGKYMNGYGIDDADEVPGAPPYEVAPGWNDWHAIQSTNSEYFYYTMTEMTNNGPVAVNTYGTTTADDPNIYITDVMTDKAVDFINSRAADATPFFLMVGEKSPHFEFTESRDEEDDNLDILQSFTANNPPAAPRDEGKFANAPLAPSPSFNERNVSDKPTAVQLFPLMRGKELAAVKDFYRNRWESMISVDDGVARIMEALRRAGKLDSTIIIFTSDNGFMLGEHRIPLGKGLLYEESSHLPFIMKIPGMSGSRTIDKLVANVDIAPTILEIAGGSPCATINDVSTCREMDGRSFLALSKKKITTWRTALLLESPAYSAVRTNDYAYGVYSTGEKELYNFTDNACHRADPYELESQHKNSCYQTNGTMNELQRLLDALKTCSGAVCWQ